MTIRNFFILAFLFSFTSLLLSQTTQIKIKNNDFESIAANNLPSNWEVTSGDTVLIDRSEKKSGTASLLMINSNWKQSEIVSESVNLNIGELYKLSGWVKSEEVETNPIDQYPTSVGACLTMESFPFTNHSPTIGATKDWTKIEVRFIATKRTDKVRLHLGFNGKVKGKVWFDNVLLEKVDDINDYITYETVKWFNNGFRYDDRGWINVHIEGKPYERGYQYGYLLANEIVEYINKLSIEVNKNDPKSGWYDKRFVADAFMLRKYEEEYLTEMKGIADGANKADAKLFNRDLDLIDIVTMNSAIDIDYAGYAMRTTPNPLSGENFLKSEDELNIPDRLHKCSSFLANKSSTVDGRIVFGQIFMWGGYTGPHWNVITDVVPEQGNRLVYQTFPGGIHSGADFYINESGIMIGETTVSQTPFNPDGSPQSNRIRKAAQYANSIDDVVKILTTNNNGMYANDWLIGDTKTDEIAVLLLGTKKHKLWRSSNKEFYGDTKDFYWCNNNNKDPEVRKEYISNVNNAPHDLIFTPWNRDLAFNKFYQEQKGNIDAIAGVNAWNTSPINRPHACDGKVTTSEMAEHLVFFANSGKVTQREKFINENGRVPDLPGATPRLSLGYAVASPIFIADQLKKVRSEKVAEENIIVKKKNTDNVAEQYSFDKRKLWFNTVYPSTESENWFISATSAYWHILNKMPENKNEVTEYFADQFAELNSRYLYTIEKEGTITPLDAKRIYTAYNHYQVPRIKGTYVLHQLRLNLGNDVFSKVMNKVHDTFREKEIETKDFIKVAEEISGKPLESFIMQWLTREDIPNPMVEAKVLQENNSWKVNIIISQETKPYKFYTSLIIETEDEKRIELIEVKDNISNFTFEMDARPTKVTFNPFNDVLLSNTNYFTWSNFFDDFSNSIIVYGTKRQIEANHTLALRFSKMLADKFTETLVQIKKDSELSDYEINNKDLIIIGNISDNSLMETFANKLNLEISKNSFIFEGKDYTNSDDGLFAAYPNPFNIKNAVYLFVPNSALQLYNMTNNFYRLPAWGIFNGEKVIEKGYHKNKDFIFEL